MTTQTSERDARIVASIPFVRAVAARFARSNRQDREECIAIAYLALVDAAQRAHAISEWYAYLRRVVWSRLIDATLGTHPILGTHTHRAFRIYRAYRAAAATAPTLSLAQLAARIGETVERVQRAIALIDSEPTFFCTAFDDGDPSTTALMVRLRAETPTPEESVVLAEARTIVGEALDTLPPGERGAVLSLLDGSGAALARHRGVSRQRVSQQRQAGLRRLRANLAIRHLAAVA